MAFVYEYVPEKDWDLFDSWKLRNTSHELMVLRRGSTTEDYRYYEKKNGLSTESAVFTISF